MLVAQCSRPACCDLLLFQSTFDNDENDENDENDDDKNDENNDNNGGDYDTNNEIDLPRWYMSSDTSLTSPACIVAPS